MFFRPVTFFALCVCLVCAGVATGKRPHNKGWFKNNVTNVWRNDPRPLSRVYGGSISTAGLFPYVVLVLVMMPDGSDNHCSGSIISSGSVLTAAHCTDYHMSLDDIRVFAGLTEGFYLEYPGQMPQEVQSQYGIKSLVIHPGYEGGQFEDDLAMLFLWDALVWTEAVGPIAMAQGSFPHRGELCRIVGWGSTDFGSSAEYQTWTSLWVTRPTLGCAPPGQLAERQLCAKGERANQMCYGDAGAPLVCQGFLAGVARALVNPMQHIFCDHPLSTSIYVDVTQYLDWIKEQAPDMLPPAELNGASHSQDGRRCLLLDGLAVGVCMSRYIW